MKHPFAEQGEFGSTISLPFDQFQLGHVPLNHAITDPPGKTSLHRVFVFLYPCCKGLQLWKVATFYLIKPVIKALSSTGAQHVGKLLNQVIGQINFWVDVTEFDKRLLLLDTELFRAAKKQKCGLPWGRKRRCL